MTKSEYEITEKSERDALDRRNSLRLSISIIHSNLYAFVVSSLRLKKTNTKIPVIVLIPPEM